MTPAEVNELLCETNQIASANVTIGDKNFDVNLEKIGFSIDYSEPVNRLFESTKTSGWMSGIGHEDKGFTAAPSYDFDNDELNKITKSWKISSIGGPHKVTYDLDENEGFVLFDGKGSIYSEEMVTESVAEELKLGNNSIAVGQECIMEPTYTADEQSLFSLAEKVDGFQNLIFVFKLDTETVTLSKTNLAGMLVKDEKGMPALDESGNVYFTEESVYDGLYEALSPYNTYRNHTFTTHDGKQVYLDFGNYGNEIDIKAEAQLLYEAMAEGETNYSSTPEYKNKALYAGADDIGPTYVEVDVDGQTLYYFENGKLRLTSDIVTGNKGRHYDTPEGVYAVFYKQRNRTLVGETYRSFVQYWIEFYPHYGLHDASWRKAGAFGGDIYLTNGSHGCVNMPTEKVAECYDIIEKGTPVIVYSYENSHID